MHEDIIQSNRGNDIKQIFVQTKSWMVHFMFVDPRCQNIIVEKCEEEQTVWEENRVGGKQCGRKKLGQEVKRWQCPDNDIIMMCTTQIFSGKTFQFLSHS